MQNSAQQHMLPVPQEENTPPAITVSTAATEHVVSPATYNRGPTGVRQPPNPRLVKQGEDALGMQSSHSYQQLGIITERPKRFEFAQRAARLQSFNGWPREHHLLPADLADAGFYFAGYGDCARCFYCGGGLRNWDTTDDIWVEHARCAFMRWTRGQAFIDAVRALNAVNVQVT